MCNFQGKVRSATWTLLAVAVSYLLSNLVNVVVTAWEFLDMNGLQTELVGCLIVVHPPIFRYFDFYMFSTDVVSLLVVLACALRLPIYLVIQFSQK